MNTLRIGIFAILLSSAMVACNTPPASSTPPSAEQKAPATTEQKPATPEAAPSTVAALYQCPMHTDKTSTDPKATCPVCGMAMEPVPGK